MLSTQTQTHRRFSQVSQFWVCALYVLMSPTPEVWEHGAASQPPAKPAVKSGTKQAVPSIHSPWPIHESGTQGPGTHGAISTP